MADLYKKLSEERKLLQDQGEIPMWYTTSGWQLFKDKYQFQNQTVKQTFRRISDAAAKHLTQHGLDADEWSEKFFQLFWKGWLSPATPVLSNMGTDKGLTVSCSGSVVPDSVYGFYESYLEAAMLTKNGFGTSGYLGNIRPRGSKISTGGKSSGVKPVIKHFVQDMQTVTQGTQRRGAFASYIEIDHADFDEVADLIQHEPDDLNIGWIVSDKFIKKLQKGNKEATRRYKKVMKTKMLTGKGYFFFSDKANRHAPKIYKDQNLKIEASNLCVRGDTILDIEDNGVFESIRIDDFTEKYLMGYYINPKVRTWENGTEMYCPISNAGVTGKSKELIRIETESGKVIECTENHLIFTKNRGWVEAGKLEEIDELVEH